MALAGAAQSAQPEGGARYSAQYCMAHLLFLSHAGADTERAITLAAAIESSPEAQAAGLKVWVDKRPDGLHRLHAGTSWQDQLEVAIASHSTSFGLLLTREGARNWVRLEVRVALDRVIAEQRAGSTYPFVPIIADDPGDLAHLPPFAQQYQGVRLTGDGKGLADLVRTAARLDAAQPVRLVAQPFMGLEAFEAKDAALFFGRRKETQELVDRLRTTNLVLVTGDSGSGKSSLVKAGLIPAFREGALADPLGRRPEPGQWHVVEMRPGTDPFEGLVEGAQRAATAGIAPEMIFALGAAIRTRDPGSIRDALRQSGPADASLLLVVDQFEELWTLTTDDTRRRDFLAALLALVPEGDLARRVVGTMRRDYYHLHTDQEHLRDRLAAHGNAGRFLLGTMAPEALRDIVEKPLLLAGESEARGAALADEVVRDVAGEPGNLALVEMALHASWERRGDSGGDLALAYQRLDRLEGALAREAEDVFWNPTSDPKKLTEPERPIAEALFMRLIRAGDAGGATRRPVAFAELKEPARAVARKLATPECRRLLVLREPDTGENDEDSITVELAHEQLVTQWPDYRFWLRGTGTSRHKPDSTRAIDKRSLDQLLDAAVNWHGRGRNNEDLARGGELTEFKRLRTASSRDAWLSPLEREFVNHSVAASEAAEHARRRWTVVAALASILLLVLASLFFWQWRDAVAARNDAIIQGKIAKGNARSAEEARNEARSQQVVAESNARRAEELTSIAEARRTSALARGLAANARLLADQGATKLQLAALLAAESLRLEPTSLADSAARLVISRMLVPQLAIRLVDEVTSMAVTPDGNHIAARFTDYTKDSEGKLVGKNTVAILNASTGKEAARLQADHLSIGYDMHFSPDGNTLAVPTDEALLLWQWASGQPAIQVRDLRRTEPVFSGNSEWIVGAPGHGASGVYRVSDGERPRDLQFPPSTDDYFGMSSAGTLGRGRNRIVIGFSDGQVSVFDAEQGTRLRDFVNTGMPGDAVMATPPCEVTRQPSARTSFSPEYVRNIVGSPDGTHIVTIADDNILRLWSVTGGESTLIRAIPDQDFVSAAFSWDGRLLAVSNGNGCASVWDVRNGQQLAADRLGGFTERLAFSGDGKFLATAHRIDGVVVWDWKTRSIFGRPLHDSDVTGLALVGNRLFTAARDGNIVVWDLGATAFTEDRMFSGDTRLAQLAPNGDVIAASTDENEFAIWTSSGQDLLTRNATVDAVDFDAESNTMLVVSRQRATLFSLRPLVRRTHQEFPGTIAERDIDGAHLTVDRAVSPEFEHLLPSATSLEKVPLVDLTREERTVIVPQEQIDRRLSFTRVSNPDSFNDQGAEILYPRRSSVCCIDAQLSPDGKMVAVSSFDWVWLFDASDMRMLGRTALGYERTIRGASPWLEQEGERQSRESSNSPASVDQMWFSADSRHLMTVTENGVIWRLSTDTYDNVVAGRAIGKIVRSPEVIASANSGRIQIADSNWSHVRELKMNGELLAISMDGRYLAIKQLVEKEDAVRTEVLGGFNPGDYRLIVVDCATGREIRTFYHGADLNSANFSSIGNLIAVSASDGIIRVWEVDTGREVMRSAATDIFDVTGFIEDRALVVRGEKRMSILPLGVDNLIEEICRRSIRNLTEAEWRDYFEGEDWRRTCEGPSKIDIQ
ncbi:MAG: TIR domain-containing protein [Geminicoccaceae bacterium]